MESEILKLVMAVITSHVDKNIIVTKKSLLKEDLALPSIKIVLCLTQIIDQLGMNITVFSDYELLLIKTVGDLTDLLILKNGVHE